MCTICPIIQQRLRRILVEHPDSIDKYLSDDDFIRNRRRQCQKTKETLEKVNKILHEDDTLFYDDIDIYSPEIEGDSPIDSQVASKNCWDVVNSGTTSGSANTPSMTPPLSSQVGQPSPQPN